MDIPLNVDVHCTDGLGGCSTRIILDPQEQVVTHLVVADRKAPHTEYLVPITFVKETTPEIILLICSREDLRNMDTFIHTEYLRETPADIRRSSRAYMWPYQPHTLIQAYTVKTKRIPPHEQEVRRGAHVQARDGEVGVIEEFLVESTSGHITHIVLRHGHLWHHKDVTIPVSEIDHIEEGTVYLKLDKNEVASLLAVPGA